MLIPFGVLSAAGVSSGPVPPLAGPALWLDAADASTFTFSTATRVSQWNDKSGNNRNFTQSTSLNQPNRNATQNSLSAVTMAESGITYGMQNTTYDWSSGAFTVLAVTRFNLSSFPTLLSRNSTGSLVLGTDNSNPLELSISRIGQATSTSNLTQAGTTTSQITYKSAGISSGNVTVQIYQNKTAASSTNSLTSLGAGDKATIGSSLNFTADKYGDNGFLCELFIYPSQLSDTDRVIVEDYLMNKWGI
jgi:hypothetical protein